MEKKNNIVKDVGGSMKKQTISMKIGWIVFFIYIVLLIRFIIFKYPIDTFSNIISNWDKESIYKGVESANLIPFKTVKMYIKYYDRINGFENLFGNICAFIPYGVLVPTLFSKIRKPWMIIIHTLWLSLGIEIFQLITHFGAFDIDDILLNCIGGIIGFYVYYFYNQIMIAIKIKK